MQMHAHHNLPAEQIKVVARHEAFDESELFQILLRSPVTTATHRAGRVRARVRVRLLARERAPDP